MKCQPDLRTESIKIMGVDYPKLTFVEPDYRFFVNNRQTTEEANELIYRTLQKFGNDPQSVRDFLRRVNKSHDVVFAFFYGSALNSNLEISKIEDVDVFIATRKRRFVYDWESPKGSEIRYYFVSELKDYLKVRKRFFLPVFTREYNALGGIFAGGLLTIKSSEELKEIIHGVRKNFNKVHVKALAQIVENDCRKRVEKRPFASQVRRSYAFYGSERLISLDEVRLMIDESVKLKNIHPRKAHAVSRRILKGMKKRAPYEAQKLT